MRTQVDLRRVRPAAVLAWARGLGLFSALDSEGYVALSRRPSLARLIMSIDTSPGRHTAELGMRLGYPRCCCRRAAAAGDDGLDAWADEVAKRRRCIGLYRLLDHTGYAYGRGYLSHVPCSGRCAPSLRQATQAVRWLVLDGQRRKGRGAGGPPLPTGGTRPWTKHGRASTLKY